MTLVNASGALVDVATSAPVQTKTIFAAATVALGSDFASATATTGTGIALAQNWRVVGQALKLIQFSHKLKSDPKAGPKSYHWYTYEVRISDFKINPFLP